jgi:hypothetical protein
MGEPQGWLFEPSFNRSVKVKASDDRITSDGGLVLLREADHRLGISEWLAQRLDDPRNQDLIRYQLVELLRERVYGLALGYSAQDDADRLAHDPAMKMAAWNRPGKQPLDERLASQPTQSRLIDILTLTPGNRAALRDSLCEACERHLRATGGDHAARNMTPSTSTAFRSWCMAGNRAPRTTATTATQSIIRWWPATRWPATTTACTRGIAWETVFCTPFFVKDKFTRRTESNGSYKRSCASQNAWDGLSICGSTRATPTARRWTI